MSGPRASAPRWWTRPALQQADWIAGRLCGRFDVGDENNAFKTGYDPIARRWPDWLGATGTRAEVLPTVLEPGTMVAPITAEGATRFGLPRETMLVAGTTDGCAAFLATGANGLGLQAGPAAAAELVLVAGSEGERRSLASYAEELVPLARAGVPALCLNPDRIMLTPHGPAFGAGRIGAPYEALGGRVTWIGKPYPEVYAAPLPPVAPRGWCTPASRRA